MLNTDNNTQATLFRIRKGGDLGSNFRGLQDYALMNYGRPCKNSLGQFATVLGKRNGIPDHQSQDILTLQKNQINQRTRYPYRTNEMKDLLPTIYNGNTNILASSGGAPLAYALSSDSELQQRLFSEGMRASAENPLSAKFAFIARQRTTDNPMPGPATDVMRRELAANEDDVQTTKRKIATGHFGSQPTFLTADTQIDPEINAFMNQQRAPTRSDLLNFQTNFHAPVNRITGSAVHNVHSINSTLNGIRSNRSAQIPNLNSIIPVGSVIGPSARYGANLNSLRYIPSVTGSVVGSSRSGTSSRGSSLNLMQPLTISSGSLRSNRSILPVSSRNTSSASSWPSIRNISVGGGSLQSNATYHVVGGSSGSGKRLSRTPSSVGSRVSRRGTTQVRPYQVLPGFLARGMYGSGRSSRTASIGQAPSRTASIGQAPSVRSNVGGRNINNSLGSRTSSSYSRGSSTYERYLGRGARP